MFWADKDGRGCGQWFEGRVTGLVQYEGDNEYTASPWATVSVQWLDDHNEGVYYENFISPWELVPAQDNMW